MLSDRDRELAKKHFNHPFSLTMFECTHDELAAFLAERDAQQDEAVGYHIKVYRKDGTRNGKGQFHEMKADSDYALKLLREDGYIAKQEPLFTHPPKNDQQSITRERFDTILYSNLDHIEGADVDRMYAQLQAELANRKGE